MVNYPDLWFSIVLIENVFAFLKVNCTQTVYFLCDFVSRAVSQVFLAHFVLTFSRVFFRNFSLFFTSKIQCFTSVFDTRDTSKITNKKLLQKLIFLHSFCSFILFTVC